MQFHNNKQYFKHFDRIEYHSDKRSCTNLMWTSTLLEHQDAVTYQIQIASEQIFILVHAKIEQLNTFINSMAGVALVYIAAESVDVITDNACLSALLLASSFVN